MKVIDIETDGLKATKIWCVVTIDTETEDVQVWRYDRCDNDWSVVDDSWIGHNILGFDAPTLNRLVPGSDIQYSRCVDTLVCSRLFNQQVEEGHSLDAWGQRLKLPKGKFDEWGAYDDPVLERDRMDRCVEYCIQDCRVTLALYRKFLPYFQRWKQSLRIEHDTAILCRELHDNGFPFDFKGAKELQSELDDLVKQLLHDLQRAFPPRSVEVREVVPRTTRFGTLNRSDFRFETSTDLSAYSSGNAFSVFRYEEFNPGSPKQVVSRLNEAGWKPFEKTEGYKDAEKELRNYRLQRIFSSPGKNRSRNSGRDDARDTLESERIRILEEKIRDYEVYGWKVSEENLETLPEDAPEGCQLFVKYRMLSKRLQTLTEWLESYDPTTGAIHGEFAHIGAWTHRMAHSKPNMGNAPSIDSKYHSQELKDLTKSYGKIMRGLWRVEGNRVLVGVDADGIQLRVLAHYMNDEEFTHALIHGDKSKGTGPHQLNALKLGFNSIEYAPRAKTFIYAWLLGAGVGKVAKILGITDSEAREAIARFIAGYPGLTILKERTIPGDAARGYFEGFDGRLIRSDEYHMLAGYLQTGEQCVMKEAARQWKQGLLKQGVPFWIRNFVHDEWQTETLPEFKELVAEVQKQSIVQAGVTFKLNCPLAGSAKFGNNWMETH